MLSAISINFQYCQQIILEKKQNKISNRIIIVMFCLEHLSNRETIRRNILNTNAKIISQENPSFNNKN